VSTVSSVCVGVTDERLAMACGGSCPARTG